MRMLMAALAALTLSAAPALAADETAYTEVPLYELVPRLPIFFKKPVMVTGELTGWGENAALDTPDSREVMVDLRGLSAEQSAAINKDCVVDHPCAAKVYGTVVQIVGTGISELGIQPDKVEVKPAAAPAAQ